MDTRVVPVGVVVLLAVGGLLVWLLRSRGYTPAERPFTPNPGNDTVVMCTGWDEQELSKILSDFTRMYQDRLSAGHPFRVESHTDQLEIRFPHDIQPTVLSFLVNYLQYPKGFDLAGRHIAAVGTVTLTDAFPLPSGDYVGKKARIYVPSNDREYDEVYVAVGSEYFEQSFTNMVWKITTDPRIPDDVRKLW